MKKIMILLLGFLMVVTCGFLIALYNEGSYWIEFSGYYTCSFLVINLLVLLVLVYSRKISMIWLGLYVLIILSILLGHVIYVQHEDIDNIYILYEVEIINRRPYMYMLENAYELRSKDWVMQYYLSDMDLQNIVNMCINEKYQYLKLDEKIDEVINQKLAPDIQKVMEKLEKEEKRIKF